MPDVFCGSEPSSFAITGTPAVSTIGVDDSFSRVGLMPTPTSGYFTARPWTSALAVGWARVRVNSPFAYSANDELLVLRSGATNIMRVVATSGSSVKLQRWTGGSWSDVGAAQSLVDPCVLVLHWEIAGAGMLSGAIVPAPGDAISLGEYAGDTTQSGAVSTADELDIKGRTSFGSGAVYSEVIIADEDCTNWRLKTLAATGAGTYSEQATGAYTAIDETNINDSDLVALNAVGERFSVAATNVSSIGEGLIVESVHVVARAMTDGSGPSAIELGVRGNSSDSYAAAQALSGTFAHYRARFTTLPGSASRPTRAQLDDYELIVRAAES